MSSSAFIFHSILLELLKPEIISSIVIYVLSLFMFIPLNLLAFTRSGVQSQRKPHIATVKYYRYRTFIILALTKGSGTEDKSFTESQETRSQASRKDSGYAV